MTKETIIKKQIKDYLRLKGWMVTTVLQGLGSQRGIPDLIILKDGLTIYLEVKTPTGKQSNWQKQYQAMIEVHGGIYWMVRSTDELIAKVEGRKNNL